MRSSAKWRCCGSRSSPCEPLEDRRVVRGSRSERLDREAAPRSPGDRAVVLAQLGDEVVVLRAARDDRDARVVLRRGPHHGRAADVDELDRGVAQERIEVRHDELEGLDAVGLHVGTVRGFAGSASRPPWIFGCSVTTRWSRIGGTPVTSARSVTGRPASASAAAVLRDDTSSHAKVVEHRGELGQPRLVVDRQQRALHLMDSLISLPRSRRARCGR